MYTHEDRADADKVDSVYAKSKILAEKAAWDFVKNEGNPFELTTMHPALIVGPTFTKDTEFTSMTIIRDVALGKYPMVPNVSIGFTDVRDCAEMHVRALEKESNQRYLIVTESMFFSDLGKLIQEEFKDRVSFYLIILD
jgi:dihydroflavonol-4-reductase